MSIVICASENNKIIDPLLKSQTHEAATIKRPSITITCKFKCSHKSPEQTAQLPIPYDIYLILYVTITQGINFPA